MDAKCNLWNGNIGFKYYYKGDTKHRLYMIADGLNNKTVINYDNIGNNEIYTPATTPVSYPYNKYNAPQYVVSQLQQSNGLGGYFTTTYQYAGGISFRSLNGFMGFLQTRMASLETLLTQQTDYLFDPAYPYVSKVDNLVTDSQGSNVSKTEEEFTVTHIANKRVRRDLWHRNTWDYLDNTSTQGTWWTNSDGNTTHQQTVYSGQAGSDDVYYENYIAVTGSPVPNAAQTIREVHIRSGKPAFERRMSIDYNAANGFINSKVIDPDKPKPLTISFVPVSSRLGLIWKEQVSGTDITTRESVYQWDSKGRYIATSQSPEGQLTQTLRDAKTGNILSETLPTGFTDQSSYDGFGRLSYNKASDQTISRDWYSGSLANCVWYEQITSPSQPEWFVYYDRLGREIETRTRAFETGKDILVHITYNNKGQKASVSGPYFSGATAYHTVFSYDPYGRLAEENYDTNTRRITYTYSPKQVVISNSSLWPSQTETREYDDLGALVKVKDHNNSELTYTYNSTGQVDLIQTPGGNVTTQYDAYGRPQQVTDPDAGTITYDYYATGEVKTQTKNGHVTSVTYNRNGQIKTIGVGEGTTTYTYSGTTGLLNFIDGINNNDVSVGYDAIGRISSRTETVEGVNYAFGYTYADDHTGRVQTMTYPGNFGVSYGYTGGYLNEIRNTSGNGLVWQLQETSPLNQPEVFTNGNNLVTTRTCDYRTGQLTRIQTGSIQDLEYSIQPSTGNMSWRRDNKHNLREDFGYDGLNRLTSVTFGGNTMDIGYSATGNITGKEDAGSYHYQEPQPHAVSAITPWGGYSPENQTAAYTSFDKLQSLTQGNKSLAITYGYDQQRRKSVFTEGTSTKTKIYIPGGYEKITEGTTTREFYYISTPAGITAVYEKVNGTGAMYYVHADHLGSVHMITNSTGGVVQELSYDAWGRQRNAANWSYADLPGPKFERGFTFHEQLTGFDLINMNGRMYDPVVGRFLSPDPVLQSPDNLQNYNRYSYCLNNPLKFTDPSGYKLRAAEMVDMSDGGGGDGWWSVMGRYGGGESSAFFLGGISGGGFGGGGYSSSWYMGAMYNPDGSINYPGPSSETVGAWFDSGLNSMMSLGDFDRYYSAGVSIRTINETRQLDWTRRNGERYLRGVRLTYSETWTSASATNGGGGFWGDVLTFTENHFNGGLVSCQQLYDG